MNIVGINGKKYRSLTEACKQEGISYSAVISYAKAHRVPNQKAFLVYSANGGNLRQKACEWTQTEEQTLRNLAGNMPAEDIAKRLNRSVLSVRKRANVLNISLKFSQQKRLSQADIDFICQNYGKMTQAKIASILGCNQASVQYHLRRNNLIQSCSDNAKAVRAMSDKPAAQIALTTGAAERTIRSNASQERISLANVRKPWTEAEEDYLRTHYPGTSYSEMSRHLGKAKNTIRTHLKVMGLYQKQV